MLRRRCGEDDGEIKILLRSHRESLKFRIIKGFVPFAVPPELMQRSLCVMELLLFSGVKFFEHLQIPAPSESAADVSQLQEVREANQLFDVQAPSRFAPGLKLG
jgi:hypothetical protein